MLDGKIRTLGAADPDPYPDAITAEAVYLTRKKGSSGGVRVHSTPTRKKKGRLLPKK